MAAEASNIDWLAVGDFRGNIEPCGCDPTADLGGLLRLSTLLKRERALTPDLLLLSTGNNLTSNAARDDIKNKFISEGLSILVPDANLLNETELDQLEFLRTHKLLHNFVLSNKVEAETVLSDIKNEAVLEHAVIFGYFFQKKFARLVQPVTGKLLSMWRVRLKKNDRPKKILLFSGTDADLSAICKAKIFNTIIRSNPLPLEKIFGNEEKLDPSPLGKHPACPEILVRTVPVGGQGVIRGGALIEKHAPSLADILGKLGDKPPSKSKPIMDNENPFPWISWLDHSYQTGSTLDDVLKKYATAKSAQFQGLAEERLKQLNATPFAGSQPCKSCHAAAFAVWEKSGHSHAFQTLKDKNQHENPDCIQCHVLGFKDKGGFVSIPASPQFANVNCENCHGPRKNHMTDPKLSSDVKIKSRQVCTECHHGTHSSSFTFEKYWPKIKHGKN